MILLFRIGSPPDNGISNGLQGEPIKNRNQWPPIMVTFCDFVGTLGTLYGAMFPSKVYSRVNGNCQLDDVTILRTTIAHLHLDRELALVKFLRDNTCFWSLLRQATSDFYDVSGCQVP
jgi:hypothetical protein